MDFCVASTRVKDYAHCTHCIVHFSWAFAGKLNPFWCSRCRKQSWLWAGCVHCKAILHSSTELPVGLLRQALASFRTVRQPSTDHSSRGWGFPGFELELISVRFIAAEHILKIGWLYVCLSGCPFFTLFPSLVQILCCQALLCNARGLSQS